MMVRTAAIVLRDGRERTVPSDNVVPGDVVLLDAGDKVPADLRLIRLANLRVDESALTGESVPVLKETAELPAATPVADRRNMLYSGRSSLPELGWASRWPPGRTPSWATFTDWSLRPRNWPPR